MDRVHNITAERGHTVQHHKAQEGVEARALQVNGGRANANIASEQDVIMGYKLIFRREPENSTVVQNVIRKAV